MEEKYYAMKIFLPIDTVINQMPDPSNHEKFITWSSSTKMQSSTSSYVILVITHHSFAAVLII